jgi:radical SAM protein with 4Fe4S-binding SPASM domain
MDNLDVVDFFKMKGNFILVRRNLLFTITREAERFPSEIQIQTVNGCNGSCRMCPIPYLPPRKNERMSDELYEKIIHEIAAANTRTVFLEYMLQNEPLLDPGLFQRIHRAKEIGGRKIITMLVTNGSLLTGSLIQELVLSNLDILNVSLDAADEETYKRVRGGFDYNTIVQHIHEVQQSGYRNCLLVSFVQQKANYRELQQFKKHWRREGISTLTFSINNRTGDVPQFEDLDLPKQQYSFFTRLKVKSWQKLSRCCITPLAEFNILWNGDVILCSNDYTKKLVLGNISDSSIEEIWNGDKYRWIRDMHMQRRIKDIPDCRYCSIPERDHF